MLSRPYAVAIGILLLMATTVSASAHSHHKREGHRHHHVVRHQIFTPKVKVATSIAPAGGCMDGFADCSMRQAVDLVLDHYLVRPIGGHRVSEPMGSGFTSLIAEARAHLGETAREIGLHRTSLWCATFMNHVLERVGYRGTGSDMAKSFASYGRRVSGPQVGAIAVLARRGGGHVGVITGIEPNGNLIIVSGNHGHRVGEGAYPRGRVIAYVVPS